MSLEFALQKYPKEIKLKTEKKCKVRPLKKDDEIVFHEFFLAVPGEERLFIKHHVTDLAVIQRWCKNIDYQVNLPLLALVDGKIVGSATLHQHQGGWKRHIGRVSVLVHPQFRGIGIARALVTNLIEISSMLGLEKVEAEFIGQQAGAIKTFQLLGFSDLIKLPDYVKDMQGITHDYIVMGLDLITDEEYAGMG
ncbi:MAG TPA: GNAT family N-acetyltransferase [Verrucomicrobiae bacterium]